MKKFVFFALALILCCGLAACGCQMSTGNDMGNTTTTNSTTATKAPMIDPTILDPTLDTNIPDPTVNGNSTIDTGAPDATENTGARTYRGY